LHATPEFIAGLLRLLHGFSFSSPALKVSSSSILLILKILKRCSDLTHMEIQLLHILAHAWA
jgi:hypothetical protein